MFDVHTKELLFSIGTGILHFPTDISLQSITPLEGLIYITDSALNKVLIFHIKSKRLIRTIGTGEKGSEVNTLE